MVSQGAERIFSSDYFIHLTNCLHPESDANHLKCIFLNASLTVWLYIYFFSSTIFLYFEVYLEFVSLDITFGTYMSPDIDKIKREKGICLDGYVKF